MIATRGNLEEWDSSQTCYVTIDNQVTGKRKTILVMRSRGETLDRLMACFMEIDPETDELVWSDPDPLLREPFATCAYIHLHKGPIVIRHYAVKGRKAARKAMRNLLRKHAT